MFAGAEHGFLLERGTRRGDGCVPHKLVCELCNSAVLLKVDKRAPSLPFVPRGVPMNRRDVLHFISTSKVRRYALSLFYIRHSWQAHDFSRRLPSPPFVLDPRSVFHSAILLIFLDCLDNFPGPVIADATCSPICPFRRYYLTRRFIHLTS